MKEALEILTALTYGDHRGEWIGFERRGVEQTAETELTMSELRSEVRALCWKCRFVVSAFSGLEELTKPYGVDKPIRLAGLLWSGFFALRHVAREAKESGAAAIEDEYELYFRYLEHEFTLLVEGADHARDYVSERFSVVFTALAETLRGSTEFPEHLSARAQKAARRMSETRTDDVFRLMDEYFDAAFRERTPISLRQILASPMDRMLLLPDYETNEAKRDRILQILIWGFSDDEWTAGDNQALVLGLLTDLYDGRWSGLLDHLRSVGLPEEWHLESWEVSEFIDRKGRMWGAIERKMRGPPLQEIAAVHFVEPGRAITLPAHASLVIQIGLTHPNPQRVVLHTSPDGLSAEFDGTLYPVRPDGKVTLPIESDSVSFALDTAGAWVTVGSAQARLAVGVLDPEHLSASPDVLNANANWADTILDHWKAVKDRRSRSTDPHADLYLLQLDKDLRIVREVRLDLADGPEGSQLTADQVVARGTLPEHNPVAPGDIFIGFSWTHSPSHKLDSPTVETWIPVRWNGSSRYRLLRTRHPGSWLGQRTFLQLAYRMLADEQRRWFGGTETTLQSSMFAGLLVAILGRQFLYPDASVSPLYLAVITIAFVLAAASTWRMINAPKQLQVVLQRMA